MKLLDATLPTPAENLALDEALLGLPDTPETLRLWEPAEPFVVLGRSSRVADEVDRRACEAAGVPVHRRVSGGGTILTGPGCLMYAVVLDTRLRPELRSIDAAHAHVLDRVANALRPLDPSVVPAGTSDLARGGAAGGPLVKFSGNSLRVLRTRLLYHGTLLYDANLALIARLLARPPREPAYRVGRSHEAFVGNLPAEGGVLRSAIADAWPLDGELAPSDALAAEVARLAAQRYARNDWRFAR